MSKVWLWGTIGLVIVCLASVPVWAGCNSSAQSYVDSGLGKLAGDTMNLSAAIVDFSTAIALDAGCGPAYVSRAMVKVWMLYDTPDISAMRARFGDTRVISDVTKGGITGATVPRTNKNYTFNTSTMNASLIQKLLVDTVVPMINSVINDLVTAEGLADTGFNFRMPGRFISSDTSAEIDIADVYFFHTTLLAAKAAIEIANSWNLDVDRDFRDFQHTDLDSSHDTLFELMQTHANYTNFFGRKTTWDTAFSLFNQAESFAVRFHKELQLETDAQDTDLMHHETGSTFYRTHVWDSINDSDINDLVLDDHPDTLVRVFSGQTLEIRLGRENTDLDSVRINFRNLFSSPFSRNSLPGSAVVAHGFEPQDNFFPDPTFGNFLPGMTNFKLFLLSDHVDSFFVVTSYGTTLDLDVLFSTGEKPHAVDVKFAIPTGGVSPIILKYSPPGRSTKWTLKVTPKKTMFVSPPHLRIFFDPDEGAFGGGEQTALQEFIDSTLILIIPWSAPNNVPEDAGSDFSSFVNYYVIAGPGDNEIRTEWQGYAADTLILYKFDGFGFSPILSTNTFKDSPVPGKTTLVSPIDTSVNLAGFGWFVVGEARPHLDVLRGFLLGDKNAALPKPFKVKLKNPLNVSTAGEPVSFRVVRQPVGASAGSFSAAGGYPITGASPSTNPTVITDTFGLAEIQYIMGNGGGIYIIEAKAVNSGAIAFLFAFTKGFTPHPGNVWRMVSPPVYPDTPIPFPGSDSTNIGRRGPTFSPATFVGDDFSNYKFYYWDPGQTNSDPKFAASTHNHYISPSSVQMGRAYWLLTSVDGVLDSVRSDSSDVYGELSETVVIPLHVGANMIGVPFAHPVRSSKLMIQCAPSAASLLQIDSATSYVEHRLWWITPTVTANGTASQSYVSGGSAPGASYPAMAMFPFEGYWIKALSACTMVFPPDPADSLPIGADGLPVITGGGSGNATAAPRLLASSSLPQTNNWSVQLIAHSSGGVDVENLAGVRPAGSPQYMAASSEPPMAPGSGAVGLAFKSGDQRYATLFKDPAEELEWQVEVTSASAGQVNIQPSDLSMIPSALPVMIRDESTGEVVDLRKEGGYTYTSGAYETRKLTFAAAPLEPGIFQKIIHPQLACLAQRLVPHQSGWLGALRSWRDRLMNFPLGRSFVSLYYSTSSR